MWSLIKHFCLCPLSQLLSGQHEVIVWSWALWCHFLHKQVQLPLEAPRLLASTCELPMGFNYYQYFLQPPTDLHIITFFIYFQLRQNSLFFCNRSFPALIYFINRNAYRLQELNVLFSLPSPLLALILTKG